MNLNRNRIKRKDLLFKTQDDTIIKSFQGEDVEVEARQKHSFTTMEVNEWNSC